MGDDAERWPRRALGDFVFYVNWKECEQLPAVYAELDEFFECRLH
jgi:hypothetical protein